MLLSQRTTGAFHALLQRQSFQDAVLVVQKSSVTEGLVTPDEQGDILDAFRNTIADPEIRMRVKRCTLLPVSVAVAAFQALGGRRAR